MLSVKAQLTSLVLVFLILLALLTGIFYAFFVAAKTCKGADFLASYGNFVTGLMSPILAMLAFGTALKTIHSQHSEYIKLAQNREAEEFRQHWNWYEKQLDKFQFLGAHGIDGLRRFYTLFYALARKHNNGKSWIDNLEGMQKAKRNLEFRHECMRRHLKRIASALDELESLAEVLELILQAFTGRASGFDASRKRFILRSISDAEKNLFQVIAHSERESGRIMHLQDLLPSQESDSATFATLRKYYDRSYDIMNKPEFFFQK